MLKRADDLGLNELKLYKSYDPDVLCILATPKVDTAVNAKAISLNYVLSTLLNCPLTVITPLDILEEGKKHLAENTASLTDLVKIKALFGDPNQFKVKTHTTPSLYKLQEYKIIYDNYLQKLSEMKTKLKS